MEFDDLVNGAFKDAAQKDAVLKLFKQADRLIEERLEKRLESAGVPSGIADKYSRAGMKAKKAYDLLDGLWRNNGKRDSYSAPVGILDMINLDNELRAELLKDNVFTSTDLPLMMPRVIEQQVREAIYPALNLTPLFQTIRFPGRGTQLTFPSTGGTYAADVAEGEEYPARKLEMGGNVTATIGKSGLAVQVTEEAVRYSLFDVIGLHLRAAGRALAMHKENKAFAAIDENATALLDNTTTAVKSTTGRDAAGNHNGTLTVYDFLYAWSTLYNTNGYVPNTIIMNPFGWLVFAQDPLMRQFFMNNGAGRLLQLPQGAPGRATQWNVGGLHNSQNVTDPKAIATSFTAPPELWPGNIQVIVSPFVGYNATSKTTDIYLCDSNEIGVLVEDEGLTMEEWDEPARDIRHMKFRERYGFATLNNSRAIGRIKGVSIARGYDFADKISISYDAAMFTGASSAQRLNLDDHFQSGGVGNGSFTGVVP